MTDARPPVVPRHVLAVQACVAAGAIAACIATAGQANWDLPLLILLLGLATLSDHAGVEVESGSKIEISGSFVAHVLAMVLLGGAPAALVGGLPSLIASIRTRESLHAARHNLVVFTAYPLVGGLVFHGAQRSLGLEPSDAAYYVLVLGTFFFALGLNFLAMAL